MQGSCRIWPPPPCVRCAYLGFHLWWPGLHVPLYPSAVGPRHLRGGGELGSGLQGWDKRVRAPLGVLSARAAVWMWQRFLGGWGFGSTKGKVGNSPCQGQLWQRGFGPPRGGQDGLSSLPVAVPLLPPLLTFRGKPGPPRLTLTRAPLAALQAVRAQVLGVCGAHHARARPRGDCARGRSGQELPHEVLQV